ncbi:MAG: NAD(P)-dependent oxidoreductase [Deltaproteobacteria bacterium]|nr:NAD(P)-dependent oxidoreductase [Deltaproteobacteria bacterium]
MAISVNVLGLGMMGRPMARKLLEAGVEVRGWNRSKLPPDQIEGIPLCRTLKEASRASVCLMMLFNSTAVNAVLEELEPDLEAGQVVMDMSSSDPAHSTIHAQRLAAKRIGWIDAPVSGGPEGAAAGTLAIMAGGAASDFETVRPVLDIMGGNVVHVGGPGMGHVVKIINQVIVGLTIEAVAEGLTLAEKAGVDPQLVQQALQGGFADSKILQIHGTRMIKRSYEPGGKATIQLKDLELARSLSKTANIRLPHVESLIRFYEVLIDKKDGELDHSAIHKLLWD